MHTTRPPATGEPIVQADGLSKSFRIGSVFKGTRIAAVDQVDLAIRPGEVLGLVGESGSGKSTLGRLLLRLVEPDAGRLMIDGRDITDLKPRALNPLRARAQIVFQNPDSSLNPRKTIGDLIARPLIRFDIVPRWQVAKEVDALLDLVRLPQSYRDRYPHQLSGGEKQRVGIARALASRPTFLVCDEPVSALDVSVQAAVLNLLAELRDQLNVAYLFVSHDIAVVAHLADRIAALYRGRIVEIGPTDAMLTPPFHPYTEALLSAAPRIEDEGTEAGDRRIRLSAALGDGNRQGCVFQSRCPRSLGAKCQTEAPPLVEIAPGHAMACHIPPAELARVQQPV